MAAQRIAFFDVDKTLLGINSGSAWLKSEWKAGRLSLGELLRAGGALFRYSLGSTEIQKTMTAAIRGQRGQSAAALKARTSAFLERDVLQHVRPTGQQRIAWHLERGDICALLTTSTQFLAEPLGDYLGVSHVLSTQLEIDANDCLTGSTVGPICYGVGKIHHARAFVQHVGGALAETTFYTDSYSDRPMLEVVGTPVVVTPDRRLRRFARRQGWPIEEWSNR